MRRLAMLAVFAALACPRAADAGGLAGRVVSTRDAALAHVVVTAQRMLRGRVHEQPFVVDTDADGHFALPDLAPGWYSITFRLSGYTAERLRVEIPRSLRIVLPPIRLPAECFARARFVSPTGSPVRIDRTVGRSFGLDGSPVPDAPGQWTPTAPGTDGTVMIGPLPRGVTVLGIDAQGFARMRLPDVRVSGAHSIVDIGTIVVTRGAELRIRVMDGAGVRQPDVQVQLVDTAALSPIQPEPVRTDAEGRATFVALGAGTYRAIVGGDRPCGASRPAAERVVALPAEGTREETLVIGGARIGVQAVRDGAPLIGVPVVLEPVRAEMRWPAWWPAARHVPRDLAGAGEGSSSLCKGATDNDGRLALSNVPFGPARVSIQLPTSIWSTVVAIPIGGRSLRVDLPEQAVSVRVLRSETGTPVASADVRWDAAEGTVHALASAAGDVLLDGISGGAGRLRVAAPGFRPMQRDFSVTPDAPQDVRVSRLAPPVVDVRVSGVDGAPIQDAVVYLDFEDGAEDDQVAPTGPDGLARFNVRRPNAVRVTAWRNDSASASVSATLNEISDEAIAIELPAPVAQPPGRVR